MNILSSLVIGTETQASAGDFKVMYAIAVKEEAKKKSRSVTIPSEDIKRINFAVLIDTEDTKEPTIQVDSFSVEFTDETKRIAYSDISRLPSTFYIKPVAFYTYDDKKITDGETTIVLNFNIQ